MFDIFEAEWTTDLFLSYPERDLLIYEEKHLMQILDIDYNS
jgi:hypothetical protein